MRAISGKMRLRSIVLVGAAACSAAACGATPPAEPRVAIAPPAATATAAAVTEKAGTLMLSGPKRPVYPPERANAEAAIDAYMKAAKLHQLDAMLACLAAATRAEHTSKPDSLSHLLARKELTILSYRTSGAGGSSSVDDKGRTHEFAALYISVEAEEKGKQKRLLLGFEVLEKADGFWLVTAQEQTPDKADLI